MARTFLVVVGFSMMLLGTSGCETVKGTANGLCKDTTNTIDNIGDTGRGLHKADKWMQENMW